jgi:hypothetical protein
MTGTTNNAVIETTESRETHKFGATGQTSDRGGFAPLSYRTNRFDPATKKLWQKSLAKALF